MARGDRIVARQGAATIEIDQREVIALANRITDGAVHTFMRAAHKQMDPVVKDARGNSMLWPRRTGKSQDATHVVDRISPTVLEVVALNPVPYTFKLRFSVVTSDIIDREARQFGAQSWARMAAKVDRVNPSDRSLKGPYAGRGGARRRVANHFAEEATRGVWKGWWPKGNEVGEDTMRRAHKRSLFDRHGQGAPSEAVAGKHVWSHRVRTPLRKREAALIEDARDALDQLAEG
jgi:hypothetical protein